MVSTRPLLLYIHGFNSSPQSRKCTELGIYLEQYKIPCDYTAPELDQWPGENARLLYTLAAEALQARPVYIIGSSLGGYYGTWLMERLLEDNPKFPVKLVLVNPAVHPYELFEDYLGPQENYYNDKEYVLTHEHIDQLARLEVTSLHRPDNIFLLAQTGDETLDYRKAVVRYEECPQRIEDGGDHSFAGFEQTIPVILSFFSPLLSPAAQAKDCL